MITLSKRYAAAALLLLSALMLAILVPGGPIETRNFSHIDPIILAAFNTFLTALGLVSVLIVYSVARGSRWAAAISALCGISYFLVYALDLGHLFPVSPDAMPPLLWWIEVAGMIVAIPLAYLSWRIARQGSVSAPLASAAPGNRYAFLITLAVIVGIAIIVYATNAAMNGR